MCALRLRSATAASSPESRILRLNSAILRRMGNVQFSFSGDTQPPLILVRSDNPAFLSVYTPLLSGLQQFFDDSKNWFGSYGAPGSFPASAAPGQSSCPWVPWLEEGGLVAPVTGFEIHCHHDNAGEAPCVALGNGASPTLAAVLQTCRTEAACRFAQVLFGD